MRQHQPGCGSRLATLAENTCASRAIGHNRPFPARSPRRSPNYKGGIMGIAGFLFVLVAFFVIFTFFGGFFTVSTAEMAVVQRLGRFVRAAGPGLNFKTPWLEKVAGRVNMRVQQFRVEVETKTKDNVFVKILVSVQYQVLQDKVYEAFYKLQSPGDQITSYVFDSVRSQVPKMILDEVFEQKDNVADSVKQELSGVMKDYGYAIIKALVTDINPDERLDDGVA